MISAESVVAINFDEEQDRPRIQQAMRVLVELKNAFAKVGCHTDTEQKALDSAVEILADVLNGNEF